MFVAALLVLLAGAAVGATTIGGLLVVPALTGTAGMAVRDAVAAASFSFLFLSMAPIVAARLRGASGTVSGPGAGAIAWAALAGAAAGALTAQWLPPQVMRLSVAGLALVSGALALLPMRMRRGGVDDAAVPGVVARVALGLVVGCGSAWSGTGGPAILMPILLFSSVPTRTAIAWAQVVQLPIAVAATAVNFSSGALRPALGVALGVLLVIGWYAGDRLARRMSTAALRTAIAVMLMGTGLWYGWTTLRG